MSLLESTTANPSTANVLDMFEAIEDGILEGVEVKAVKVEAETVEDGVAENGNQKYKTTGRVLVSIELFDPRGVV